MDKFINVVSKAIEHRKLANENKELMENLVNLNRQLESRLNQIFALGKVSKVITHISDLETILQAIINISGEITKAEKVALLLLDESSKELVAEFSKGFDPDLLRKLRIKVGEGIIGFSAEKRRPLYKTLLEEEHLILGTKERELFGDEEFLCLPINYRDNLFGLLILTSFPPNHIVGEEDVRLLSILSQQASIAINNSLLYERLQNKYLATLEVLVSALEAKCKNTKGHSQRVSIYAREFAKFLGMLEKEIQILEKACAIHDIGKIVIPESILAKPDKLTEEEMEQMRAHPLKGVDILVPLGILKEMIPVVRNHHERYDGKGYPDALKDGEIPFEAKLVAIIDAYDAMTSVRSYRKKCFTREEALREIESKLGTQFDPELGHKFLQFAPDVINPNT
jgi:HD-GYP domain-containing protein (c-di-GMP phosphodiesterase class II)